MIYLYYVYGSLYNFAVIILLKGPPRSDVRPTMAVGGRRGSMSTPAAPRVAQQPRGGVNSGMARSASPVARNTSRSSAPATQSGGGNPFPTPPPGYNLPPRPPMQVGGCS